MRLPIVFASGCTIFLLGIPISFVLPYLGTALIISGSIIVAAWVIGKSLRPGSD